MKEKQAQNLNTQQQQAVEAPNRPLLIVAGAGTGKTRTLTNRLIYLIQQGVPAGTICAITFTNKAAKEMASRVAAMSSEHPYIGTFHSLGSRILRKEGRAFGRTPNYAIFDEQDSLRLMKKLLKGTSGIQDTDKPSFFLSKISMIKNGVLGIEELGTSAYGPDRRAVGVYERYEEELKKNNAFDFDDLILKVLVLFRSHTAILKKYQNRFKYILVDEYQDLNNTQYDLVRLLAGESRQVSVVGDDAQLIYQWRYANMDIFLNFERDWPDAQVMLLEENYRSSKTIIEASSALIANNKKQKPKRLHTHNPMGEPIKVFEALDDRDEASWIAERLERVKIKNQNESVAILYRTNAQSRALEQEFIEREIPYTIFGGLRFYERREVKDVIAALRYAANPRDSISYERLGGALGKRRAAELEPMLKESGELPPTKAIERFLARSGYLEYLDRTFLNAAERRDNITELIHFASRFAAIPEFLEQASLVQSTDEESTTGYQLLPANSKQQSVKVNMMTIHMAKGLEFDTVFVAGCSEGLLPHARSIESADQVEEERRLMYVAMTRARHKLFLSFSNVPSRFLFEIPQEYTEFESAASSGGVLEDNEERYISIE